ncbi:MAG: PD40 domain-containing protein [Anaerolineae bacterium]|nr:PD40 domain-containing protein [Anaerolineae bacterium]
MNEMVFVSDDESVLGLYNPNLDDFVVNRVVEQSGYDAFRHHWSPDGRYIAFSISQAYGSDVVVPGGGDVYVIKKVGIDMRVLTDVGNDGLVGWANDSQYVIYYKGEPGGAGGSYFALDMSGLT